MLFPNCPLFLATLMSLEKKDNLYQIHVLGLKKIPISMMRRFQWKRGFNFKWWRLWRWSARFQLTNTTPRWQLWRWLARFQLTNATPRSWSREQKYHNFRYVCEEKTCRCFFTNKTAGTKINNTTSKASCKRITKTWSREQKYHNFRYACEDLPMLH